MDHSVWIKRTQRRSDITTRLTHLTRGNGEKEAFDVLNQILEEKVLRASSAGYIIGNEKVVCFQDIPMVGIAENIICENQLRKEKGYTTIRYNPFGIRVNKQHAFRRGAREVIYGKKEEMKSVVKESEWWRIVTHNMDIPSETIDWTHEREWRIKGDYLFEYSEIEVIVENPKYYKKFMEYWMDKNPEMLKTVNGIICIDSCIR